MDTTSDFHRSSTLPRQLSRDSSHGTALSTSCVRALVLRGSGLVEGGGKQEGLFNDGHSSVPLTGVPPRMSRKGRVDISRLPRSSRTDKVVDTPTIVKPAQKQVHSVGRRNRQIGNQSSGGQS